VSTEATVSPNAHQRARHTDFDEATVPGDGFAIQPDAPIHERLSHTVRELFSLQVGHGAETDDVTAGRLGVDIRAELDESRGAHLGWEQIDLRPRRERSCELPVDEALLPAELLVAESTDHQRIVSAGQAGMDDRDLDHGLVVSAVITVRRHVGRQW